MSLNHLRKGQSMRKSTLKHILHTLIEKSEKEQLSAELGYQNIDTGISTLKRFLHVKSLYQWLHYSKDDSQYTTEEFILHLCKRFNIAEEKLSEIKNAKNIKIKACTYWLRKGESATALGCASYHQFILIKSEELCSLNRDDRKSLIKNKIKEHHERYNGTLPIFGKVMFYSDGKDGCYPSYRINTQGEVVGLHGHTRGLKIDFYRTVVENLSLAINV